VGVLGTGLITTLVTGILDSKKHKREMAAQEQKRKDDLAAQKALHELKIAAQEARFQQEKGKHQEQQEARVSEFLGKMTLEFAEQGSHYGTIIAILEAEEAAKASNPNFASIAEEFSKRQLIPPAEMRDLPGFLEPIGITLSFMSGATDRAYEVFSKEVLLCKRSTILWLDDSINSPYWKHFKQFVEETEKRVSAKSEAAAL
jgi:hypothetical protein